MKSPFYVKQEFISPFLAEQVVDTLMADITIPDTDIEGVPVTTFVQNEQIEQLIFERIEPLIDDLEDYYEFEYQGTEDNIMFEWRSERCKPVPQCENSSFLRKKWLRTKERDITGIVFLNDFNDKTPFESEYEVYGGKLEFPQHGFSFNPQKGTLILFPSGPHFINAFSEVLVGESLVARFHMVATKPYMYDVKKFPGDYRTWFKEFV